jgi:hypothetical protein
MWALDSSSAYIASRRTMIERLLAECPSALDDVSKRRLLYSQCRHQTNYLRTLKPALSARLLTLIALG